MNILYYVPNISKSWGGVYQYSLSLLKSLAEDTNYKNQYYVYLLNKDESYSELAGNYENIHLILEKHRPIQREPFWAESKAPYRVAEPSLMKIKKGTSRLKRFIAVRYNYRLIQRYKLSGYRETTFLDLVIRKNQIQIIHCPFQAIYTIDNIPAITTMHDVQELYFPQFFTSAERAYRAVNYKEAIDNASAVIVSYQHIKEDIVKYFSKPDNQVHVCLLDMKDLWFDRLDESNLFDLKEYALPKNFILYPAATWAHKNHIKLLEALSFLNRERNFELNLVCTGHKNSFFADIQKVIDRYELNKNVHFLGIVSDEVLFSLYHQASAVVVPTMYEAGSFPLMESMLLNIPVICSNVTSLPMTIGKDEYIFDPNSHVDMANKIYKIVTDQHFCNENIENSKLQAIKLRNSNVSEKINNIYKSISR